MPELPEVETVVQELQASSFWGLAIVDVQLFYPQVVRQPTVAEFCRLLKKDVFTTVRRRGKYIHFSLKSGYHLLLHLRMSGRLSIITNLESFQKSHHDRALIIFAGNMGLLFTDQRKFGRFDLVSDELTILGKLGVEPLTNCFSPQVLLQLTETRSINIKALLLDQSKIAGIGNIYADEALFVAKISPLRLGKTLHKEEVNRLYNAIVQVLTQGIENMGTTLGTTNANFYNVAGQSGKNSTQLAVFRQEGKACPTCGTTIQKIRVAGRGTHFCPKCQT